MQPLPVIPTPKKTPYTPLNTKNTPTDKPTTQSSDDTNEYIQMQPLLSVYGDIEQAGSKPTPTKAGAKAPTGLLERFLHTLDERYRLRTLILVWGPRLEFVVRLMLVATFLDDSLRTAVHFPSHMKQVGADGCLKWLVSSSPALVGVIATIVLGVGLLAQSLGSYGLLALRHCDLATKALIGWTIVQPVLYMQYSNIEFVTESISLVGGLLLLRAHLCAEPQTQLIGRLLLPTMYLYYAGSFLFSAFTYDETNSVGAYMASLSIFVVTGLVLLALVIGCMLVATGLKSRLVALLLALFNLGYVCYQHPFFLFVWWSGGEWKYDESKMEMPNVALADGMLIADFDNAQIYDLHKYYFFLGLSTSGGLLLLVQFGPGAVAVQKNEVLLPVVTRAQD